MEIHAKDESVVSIPIGLSTRYEFRHLQKKKESLSLLQVEQFTAEKDFNINAPVPSVSIFAL